MKKSQNGFIVPVLLAIIAFLLAGGGTYVYMQKKSVNSPVVEGVVSTQATSTSLIKTQTQTDLSIPVIYSVTPLTASIGSTIDISGYFYNRPANCQTNGCIMAQHSDVSIKNSVGQSQVLLSETLSGGDGEIIKLTISSSKPCVATPKGDCFPGAYVITPGQYSLTVTTDGVESNSVPLTVTSAVPAVSSFRTIKLYDSEGKKVILSPEDSFIVETVLLVLKDDKNVGWHLNDMNQIVVSSGNAFVSIGRPIGGCAENDFVIDIKNKKITDTFGGYCHSSATQKSIVIGNDKSGFLYYIYGEPSSVKIPNSVLTGNQSYVAYDGPEGSMGYKVVATTTNSITFGIFDKTVWTVAPGDDMVYHKKIGEKTFMIP